MKGRSTVLVVLTIIMILSVCSFSSGADKVQLTGPYDSFRDYVAALEARGKVLRIKEMDADQYEPTAFLYRMLDKMGYEKAPAFMIEKVKINGKVMEGPVVGNAFCGWDSAAMVYGVDKITDDQREMYKAVVKKIASGADSNGQWKKIKPVTVDKSKAPCKEVIEKGDDVDLFKFAWVKNNPADVGPYVSSAAVFMEDPELGRNVGTYRCQIKGKNKVGVNPEMGQHGWIFMQRAKKRGEQVMKVALVLGTDPITYAMSSTKLAGLGVDEVELAGGFRGKPVEMVKCETSDLLVPAQAEMIIEGDVPTGTQETEGPYGEMFGYIGGLDHKNYYMNITCITHRKNPIILNSWTGIDKPTHMIPWGVSAQIELKKMLPNLVEMYSPREAIGISILSIDKKFPGDGMAAGQVASGVKIMGTAKVIIVVDKDVDPTNITAVLHAIATRWQPYPAGLIIPQSAGMALDPSAPKRMLTSKIVIDATQQLPEEGGPKSWPPVSRVALEEKAPGSFKMVDEKWAEYWKNWKK